MKYSAKRPIDSLRHALSSARLTTGVVLAIATACITALGSQSAFATDDKNSRINGKKNETQITFEAQNGTKVAAFKGWLEVPENRSNPDSRMIKLDYVRFPQRENSNATSIDRLKNDSQNGSITPTPAGSPIVYLAGGPGGSGIQTAKYKRFDLFMAMREFGDVIAFDQRGINENRLPCESKQAVEHAKVFSQQQSIEKTRLAIQDCLAVWADQGIDIYGYTTLESARDLNNLRQHLGAQKISLWGISYGSHLALAAMKTMQAHIDKVVISSVEGLNQTIKMPARTDQYFSRLQAAINTVPSLKAQYPDIKSLIRRVHQKLSTKPLMFELTRGEQSVTLAFQKRTIQSIASSMIADPQNALILLGLYHALDTDDHKPVQDLLSQHYPLHHKVSLSGMSTAIDLASGITAERYQAALEQSKTSLLGDTLNFGLHHFNDIENLDLGDDFRIKPVNDIPTLVLSGTLDGRTYLKSQQEATAGLSNAHYVVVENAGHNLFMSSPAVTEVIKRFMEGGKVETNRIKVALPPHQKRNK